MKRGSRQPLDQPKITINECPDCRRSDAPTLFSVDDSFTNSPPMIANLITGRHHGNSVFMPSHTLT